MPDFAIFPNVNLGQLENHLGYPSMFDMFWNALELSILIVGLITRLPLLVKKLVLFKFDGLANFGNTVYGYIIHRILEKPFMRSVQSLRCLDASRSLYSILSYSYAAFFLAAFTAAAS